MYLREKYDPERGRTRLQIVRSVRTADGPRQRVVRHIGTADSPEQLASLRKLGEVTLEELRQAGTAQQSLFTPKQYADLAAEARLAPRLARFGVDLAECREEMRLMLGVREAFTQIYSHLGWNQVLGARRTAANRILRELVLARIAQPQSKRATVCELERSGVSLNLDRVYQTMDHLEEAVIARIREQSHQAAQKLYDQPLKVFFFDCTTLYFESEQEDPLRAKGYSKDGKPHRCQVLLALMTTCDGLPVDYALLPGNTFEGKTLMQAVTSLQQRHPGAVFTVVADAAMLSRENQTFLQEQGLAYVLGYRLKSAPAKIKLQALSAADDQGWLKTQDLRYRMIRHEGRRIIVTYSRRRARKDQEVRERILSQLRRKYQRSERPAGFVARGYACYLSFPAKGRVKIDAAKVTDAARWDGLRAIIAHGNEEMAPKELLSQYRRLWEVEHCFRTNKHDLCIRPIFHWKPRRIQAHIAICYMAFCCLQQLRRRLKALGFPMSAERIRRELDTLQLSILVCTDTQKRYAMPSRASADANRIYRSVGLKWNEAPFPLPDKSRPGGS